MSTMASQIDSDQWIHSQRVSIANTDCMSLTANAVKNVYSKNVIDY